MILFVDLLACLRWGVPAEAPLLRTACTDTTEHRAQVAPAIRLCHKKRKLHYNTHQEYKQQPNQQRKWQSRVLQRQQAKKRITGVVGGQSPRLSGPFSLRNDASVWALTSPPLTLFLVAIFSSQSLVLSLLPILPSS